MRKKLATGPIVSNGTVSSNRTYQDLLKNTRDELNFENIVTAELQSKFKRNSIII
jgi:hypothetical protein